MIDSELAALLGALAEAVELQPSIGPVILPPAAWLEEHARLLDPVPTTPRLAVVGGQNVEG